MDSKYIVAEASKNWAQNPSLDDLISHKFEKIININLERGYKLIDWKMTTTISDGVMSETIIAIFEKI